MVRRDITFNWNGCEVHGTVATEFVGDERWVNDLFGIPIYGVTKNDLKILTQLTMEGEL